MPVDSNIPTEVKELLKLHPGLACTENGRIKCTVTNHEMPCRHDSVLQHVKGKKYLRLTTGITGEFDITKYEPHIMPSNKKGHENQLFCTLTLRHLNKIPSHLEKHVNGKRYKKAKAKWEACQLSGEKFVPLPLLQR
uniref:Uncharacterized protein n=1 Tax=Ciona intestinalis TaxID=7719 RepID=F6YMT1_CIOIN